MKPSIPSRDTTQEASGKRHRATGAGGQLELGQVFASSIGGVTGWIGTLIRNPSGMMSAVLLVFVLSLLAGLGILGLALGFAFQDIAGNFIAGIFLSVRRPFTDDDLVETNGFRGTLDSSEAGTRRFDEPLEALGA